MQLRILLQLVSVFVLTMLLAASASGQDAEQAAPAPEPAGAEPAPNESSAPAAAPGAPAASSAELYPASRREPEMEPPDELAPWDPRRPERSGFTLELGLGIALTHTAVDGGGSDTNFGLAPLSLSLGGFLTSELALMFRLAGTSWFVDIGSETTQIGSYFYGAALQYWLSDVFFLAGGAGLALYDDNPLFSSVNIESETGFGLTARAGYSFYVSRHHSLGVVLELFPMFYEPATTMGAALNFQWQLL